MRLAIFLISAALVPTPGMACEIDTGAVRLPGESEEEYSKREYQILRDKGAHYNVSRQSAAFEEARTIYVAVVKSSASSLVSSSSQYEAIVEPKRAIRGSLPSEDRRLVNPNTGGMCFEAGDGSGANAAPGEIVVVLEGLSKTEWRPNGIDSFRATESPTYELLEALAKYLGVEPDH
jgi:hypothetical protein